MARVCEQVRGQTTFAGSNQRKYGEYEDVCNECQMCGQRDALGNFLEILTGGKQELSTSCQELFPIQVSINFMCMLRHNLDPRVLLGRPSKEKEQIACPAYVILETYEYSDVLLAEILHLALHLTAKCS